MHRRKLFRAYIITAKITGNCAPLVLIPSGISGWLNLESPAERLAATRKVIRLQLLNMQYALEEKSVPPDYSVKTESHALARTLKELGLNELIDIVAWHYGAMVALDYASDNPTKINSLTAI
jgi:pimeloyl-ACP methyl ester carboxylesterase